MKIDTSLTRQTASLSNYELIEFLKHPALVSYSLRQLQTEFHARFKNRLYQNCLRLCHRNRVEDDVAKDIFQDTILKALEGINKFSLADDLSFHHSTNTVFKWLNKIAFNLFLNFLKTRYKFSDVELCDEDLLMDYTTLNSIDDIEISAGQINLEATLQSAWDNLNYKETLVIYYCIKYNCLNQKHMPDNVINEVSEVLNVKPDSIRQIKLRALIKFRAAFNL